MTPVALPSPVQHLLAALQREIKLTRPFLERLPADQFDWQPHAKSMTLGQLASHLADMLGNIEDTLATNSYDMATAPAADRPATATSPAEILARFDHNACRACGALLLPLLRWRKCGHFRSASKSFSASLAPRLCASYCWITSFTTGVNSVYTCDCWRWQYRAPMGRPPTRSRLTLPSSLA
jgi:hypothetical protein